MQVLNTPHVSFGRTNTYLTPEENEVMANQQMAEVDAKESIDSTKKVSVPAGVLAAALAGLLLTDCTSVNEISLDGKKVSISSTEALPQNAIQKKVTKDGIVLTRNGVTRVINYNEILKYEKDPLRKDLLKSYLESESPELLWHASFEVTKLFYTTYSGRFQRCDEAMEAGPRTFAHELAHAMDHHSDGAGFTKFSGSPSFIKVANEEYDVYQNATNNDLHLPVKSTNELWAECAAVHMSRNYKSKNAEALKTYFPRTMAMVKSQMEYLNTLPASQRVNQANVSNYVRGYNPNDELAYIRYYDNDGNCVKVEKKKTSGKPCIPYALRADRQDANHNPMEVISK